MVQPGKANEPGVGVDLQARRPFGSRDAIHYLFYVPDKHIQVQLDRRVTPLAAFKDLANFGQYPGRDHT